MFAKVRRDERGNIVPLALVSIFLLLAVMAFVADIGIAYYAKDRQEQVLDAARTVCMDAAVSQQAKYADDPGRVLSEQIVRTVRAQGFSGAIDVWFYEAPKGSVSESERYWVVGMQLSQDVPTMFAKGLGLDSIEAASCRIVEARPYASQKVWRPAKRICGKYSFSTQAGADQGKFVAVSELAGFPAEMAERAAAAM